jgi:hypothetical protein
MCITTAEAFENCQWGAEKKTVMCQSCGGEAIYDILQISSICPFCESNKVMESSCENTMAPGGVVTFRITNQQAKDLFHKWLKKKWFCPKPAKETAVAKDFRGIYLPYWTFSTDTVTNYTADYGRNRRVKRGKNYVTVTDWYKTSGVYRHTINDELIPATTNHNQRILRGIEPFNTADNRAYKPEFVAGFVAERYAIGIKEAWRLAKQKIHRLLQKSVDKVIRRENRADKVIIKTFSTAYDNLTYKYLLLPVWMASFKYRNKVYSFKVNGQTGRVAGNAPLSPLKIALAVVAGIVALLFLTWFLGIV